MINRKALFGAALVALVMIAVNVWCLYFPPAWQHVPVNRLGTGRVINGARLFLFPFCIFLLAAIRVARKWFLSGPDEAVQRWRTFSTKYFVWTVVLLAGLYGVAVAGELGYTQFWSPLTVARFTQVAAGLLIVAMGNVAPKLPWLSARISLLRLNPWQWNRYARVLGILRVGTGLVLILGGLFLPPVVVARTVLALWFAGIAAMIWYRIKLRREPQTQL